MDAQMDELRRAVIELQTIADAQDLRLLAAEAVIVTLARADAGPPFDEALAATIAARVMALTPGGVDPRRHRDYAEAAAARQAKALAMARRLLDQARPDAE